MELYLAVEKKVLYLDGRRVCGYTKPKPRKRMIKLSKMYTVSLNYFKLRMMQHKH